jgi:signal transduction histidine kinase
MAAPEWLPLVWNPGRVVPWLVLAVVLQALLVAGLLLERIRRRAAERSLATRLSFETLAAELSAALSSAPLAEVDREITRALRRIADFLGADWGSLAEFPRDTRAARITHSWVAEGAAPGPATVVRPALPWVTDRLERGEVVRFSRLEELPADAAAVDRQSYLTLGIKSQVEVPLKLGGALLGALSFGTLGTERVWADEPVQRLQLLGEVFANVLSRKQWELEAQRLRRELGHVGRVSTIGELTVSLAHQLRQPLAAILSNAQTAQDALESSAVDLAEIREILADIVEDDKRAAEVIGRLRGLLKKGSLEFTELDVNELVGEVARLVSADASLRNISLRLDLAPRLPVVPGDRVQVQQVVLNLVLNGLDALRDLGGERTLELWTAAEGAGAVRVGVRDSGTGIEETDLEQVFEAFYTTKPDGLGMGLAIARSIVEAHGGRLTARNHPEGGAILSFTLPVAGPEP